MSLLFPGPLAAYKKAVEKVNSEKNILSSSVCAVGCTKIWRFHQEIIEPSQKLDLTIRRKHANF